MSADAPSDNYVVSYFVQILVKMCAVVLMLTANSSTETPNASAAKALTATQLVVSGAQTLTSVPTTHVAQEPYVAMSQALSHANVPRALRETQHVKAAGQ